MKIEKNVLVVCILITILIFALGFCFYKFEQKLFLETKLINKKLDNINENIIVSNKEIQSLINDNQIQLLNNLQEISNSSKNQFYATKKMKVTYDELLEEQKKKTVDIAEKDLEIKKMILQADEFYQVQDYKNSYKIYSKVLLYQSDNFEVRSKKLCSLYYINPMDSSSYQEILEDCRILKINGKDTDQINKIESAIKQEMQGIENE